MNNNLLINHSNAININMNMSNINEDNFSNIQ